MSELPTGWIEVPIGMVCEVVGGSTPRTTVDDYWDGDIPWLTPDDLSRDRSQYVAAGRRCLTKTGYSSCSTQLIPAGSVLYTSRAPIGYVAIAKQAVCTNQGFKSFVPPPGLSSRYLYWYLQSATPMIRKLGSGTTFAEISGKVAKTIPLRLPPTAEQERIVVAIEEQLSRLDTAEQLLRSSLQRCDVLSRSFMRTLEEWPLVPLADLLEKPLANGRSVPTAENGSGFPVLRLTALRNGFVDLSERKVGAWGRRDAERYIVQEGDFLIARGNGSLALVGRGGLVTADPDAVAYPDTMIRARVDRKQMSPEFLRWVWDSSTVRRQIERAAKTTAGIHKVNQQDLGHVAVPLPPPEVQGAIVGDLERQQSVLQALTKSIHQALGRSNQLRRSVLECAFSGRLVPQDPNDEPAPELLARIASDHRKTAKPRRRQRA